MISDDSFGDFTGLALNEQMTARDNFESIIHRVSSFLWAIVEKKAILEKEEDLLKMHDDLVESVCIKELEQAFQNIENLDKGENYISLGAELEKEFYEKSFSDQREDYLLFWMLYPARIAVRYAFDANFCQDTLKKTNYMGRAWFYVGILTSDQSLREQFEREKTEKMRDTVNIRHKKAAAESEVIRLKVIGQWEKGNPKTGAGWSSMEAAATYLVGHIDKPYSTIRNWISTHEKNKRKQP